jgi:hypothetical protein
VVISSLRIIRFLTDDFQKCRICGWLEQKLGYAVSVAYGIGTPFSHAMNNVQIASKEAKLLGQSFVVDSNGNLIGPYILGDAVGLPTLWVMFAIIVGGALFGVIGMFIGVPVFSVIFELTKERVSNNLSARKIDVDTK